MKVKMSFDEIVELLNFEICNSGSLFLISVRDELLQQSREIKYLRHYSNRSVLSSADSAMTEGELDQ